MSIYLASQSPRRRELLQQIGVSHQVIQVEVDETPLKGESADAYVMRLALAKARAGWQQLEDNLKAPVLGSDTAVVIDGKILGKPESQQHAIDMLMSLSGRTHQVLSGVALVNGGEKVSISRSDVTFRELSKAECLDYWHTGECHDKAGSYAIQGHAAMFISRLDGSYSGVMGLPLYETAELLQNAGVNLLGPEPKTNNKE